MRVLQNERLCCRSADKVTPGWTFLLPRTLRACSKDVESQRGILLRFQFFDSISSPGLKVVTAKHSGILKVNQWGKKSRNTSFIFQGDSVFFLPVVLSLLNTAACFEIFLAPNGERQGWTSDFHDRAEHSCDSISRRSRNMIHQIKSNLWLALETLTRLTGFSARYQNANEKKYSVLI